MAGRPRDDQKPDLCVIGGGTAGHALAFAAAALGARCTLVDPRPRLGAGQAADLFEAMFFAEAMVHPRGTPFDWPGFRRRLGQALATQAAHHSAERLATIGVALVRGAATFADPATIVAAGQTIRARRFVVATGAAAPDAGPTQGPAPGRGLRPADLLARPALPAAIDIIAAVPRGFEWAQALARAGCAVTLLMQPGATQPFDAEVLAPLLAALRRDGIAVGLDAAIEPATSSAPTMVLARPAPAVAGLELGRAGVDLGDGAPMVDRGLRTTNRRIFAIGDVLGDPCPGGGVIPRQVATVLRGALFRLPAPLHAGPVAATLRTAPAVAQVGRLDLSAAEAGTHRLLRFPLAETQRGTAAGGLGGAKVVATKGGRILGAALVGQGAAEAIGAWTLAITRRIPLGAMAGLPVPDDSLAESGRRAALAFVTGKLRSGLVRRLIGLLRRLP